MALPLSKTPLVVSPKPSFGVSLARSALACLALWHTTLAVTRATTITAAKTTEFQPRWNTPRRRRRRLRAGTECTLYLRDTEYQHEERHAHQAPVWMCEIPACQAFESGSSTTTMLLVRLEGLDDAFFSRHRVRSGSTTMTIRDGYLEGDSHDDGEIEDIQEESKEVAHGTSHAGSGLRNIFLRLGSDSNAKHTINNSSSSSSSSTSSTHRSIMTKMVVASEDAVEVTNDFSDAEDDSDEEDAGDAAAHNIFHRGPPSSRRGLSPSKPTVGELTTLVIRVVAEDGTEPSLDAQATRKRAFLDPVCLKSQYAACSRNQLILAPFDGTTTSGHAIERGVVDVRVDVNPAGRHGTIRRSSVANRDEFASRANLLAEEQLGNLPEQFDLVLFCLPPGILDEDGDDDWKAFANVNRWDSYYNDEWCGMVSAQLHEVGHNLNLAHSGEGSTSIEDNEYEDKSGMMGVSFPNDDAPKMCFNGAKNYQLDWYARQRKSINPTLGSEPRVFVMNGIVDYKVEGDTQDKLISLRLNQKGKDHDYYIGYNRASSFNEGTLEDVNEIVIWEKPTGGPFGFGASWKLASLRYKDQRYVIPGFGPKKDFVEIKLLSDTTEGNYKNGKEDVPIQISSYDAAEACPYPHKDLVSFQLKGQTDDYGHEIVWSLALKDGGYLDFGSGYEVKSSFESTNNLCPGRCYVFEINDLFGDGLIESQGGFFGGTLDGEEIFEVSTFGSLFTRSFCVPGKAIDKGNGNCVDSTTLQYKRKKKRNCKWVGKRKKKRCNKVWQSQPLEEHCPKACGKCS